MERADGTPYDGFFDRQIYIQRMAEGQGARSVPEELRIIPSDAIVRYTFYPGEKDEEITVTVSRWEHPGVYYIITFICRVLRFLGWMSMHFHLWFQARHVKTGSQVEVKLFRYFSANNNYLSLSSQTDMPKVGASLYPNSSEARWRETFVSHEYSS